MIILLRYARVTKDIVNKFKVNRHIDKMVNFGEVDGNDQNNKK